MTCLGVDAVIAYDARAANPHLHPVRRWKVASGPTGIVVDAARRRAIVWSQFAHTLGVIPLDDTLNAQPTPTVGLRLLATNIVPRYAEAVASVLPAHGEAMSASLALGRRLFHAAGDMAISGDGRACASCHPDGRDDALTWATPDGPRQTPILAARLADTAPYGWNGTSLELKDHVHRTFRRLFGVGVAPREFDALLGYVRQMKLPFARAASSAEAARGEVVFHSAEAGCATCHLDGATADGKSHDVQSRIKGDTSAQFDTPSLRFLGQSAPYFHDGRYATLGDLLRGVDGAMGHTAHLDDGDRRALLAYLEAL